MKKTFIASLYFMFLVLIFTGCSKSKENLVVSNPPASSPTVPPTVPTAPILLTGSLVTINTPLSAIATGTITGDGGAAVTSRGICWSAAHIPTTTDNTIPNGSGTGSFTGSLTGLTVNMTYYIRAYASNSTGLAYGQSIMIVTDGEGNVYNTVVIGTQTWMVENLRVTKYNNGTAIPYVAADADWSVFTSSPTPKFCWYQNDVSHKNDYGGLYNWYVVNTGILAPTGWHVPTHNDFKTLIEKLDPGTIETIVPYGTSTYMAIQSTTAGAQLKETGSVHWDSPNYASNSSGFGAVGGGVRQDIGGNFDYLKTIGGWWTSDTVSNYTALRFILGAGDHSLSAYGPQGYTEGLSVRCIKN